jgi:hypothetical protein
MASWPQLGSTSGQVLLKAAAQLAKWTLPSFVCGCVGACATLLVLC